VVRNARPDQRNSIFRDILRNNVRSWTSNIPGCMVDVTALPLPVAFINASNAPNDDGIKKSQPGEYLANKPGCFITARGMPLIPNLGYFS